LVDRGDDALAQVLVLVVVAELDGLVLAGRRARGHRRTPDGAALQADLHLDGGVAAGIQNLTTVDESDLEGHADPSV
jgi:hypothetical protein